MAASAAVGPAELPERIACSTLDGPAPRATIQALLVKKPLPTSVSTKVSDQRLPTGYCFGEVRVVSARPMVFAHRGASAYAPENTFAAFDLAIEMGAPAMETDVQATADGHLVLLHDARVDRTTDGHGPLADLTLAEVEALDAGGRFDPRFAGLRVPRAEELLARYGGRVRLRLEVKSEGVVDQLVRLVEDAGLLDAVEFSSFDLDFVTQLCARAPTATVCYLVQAIDQRTIGETSAAGARIISGRAASLTPEAMTDARRAGLEVSAWGVGDDQLLAKVIALGVGGFTSNWPDRALRLLRD